MAHPLLFKKTSYGSDHSIGKFLHDQSSRAKRLKAFIHPHSPSKRLFVSNRVQRIRGKERKALSTPQSPTDRFIRNRSTRLWKKRIRIKDRELKAPSSLASPAKKFTRSTRLQRKRIRMRGRELKAVSSPQRRAKKLFRSSLSRKKRIMDGAGKSCRSVSFEPFTHPPNLGGLNNFEKVNPSEAQLPGQPLRPRCQGDAEPAVFLYCIAPRDNGKSRREYPTFASGPNESRCIGRGHFGQAGYPRYFELERKGTCGRPAGQGWPTSSRRIQS